MSSAAVKDPILADAADVRALSGLSGARVVLMTRDGRTWFVRKAAATADGSLRLRRQLDKQLAFTGLHGAAVSVPQVLGHGELDGRFYFDMEFVRGMDGVNYLRRASYPEVGAFADRICAYVAEVSVRTTDRPAPCTLFDALYTKLCDVQRRTSQLSGHTLASIFLALEQLRDLTPDLQATFCHGDLTLENIIVDDRGRPWLVDFLDAPFEHWWQDVAKLHQDLDGGWYLLSQSPIARCVVDYLSKRVLAAAAARDPRYALVHSVMLACTFARILPYVRTPEELEFVRMRVEYFAEQARSP